MPVTTRIDSFHGASPTPSTAVTVYYNRTDSDTLGTSADGIVVPSAGPSENLSWRRVFKINFTSTPATKIANLRFYVDAPPSGLHHYAMTTNGYVQPNANDESGINNLSDNTTSKDTTNETLHSATNPLYVNNGDVLANPNTGYGTQSYVTTQVGVTDTYDPAESAVSGRSSTLKAYYRYQES